MIPRHVDAYLHILCSVDMKTSCFSDGEGGQFKRCGRITGARRASMRGPGSTQDVCLPVQARKA